MLILSRMMEDIIIWSSEEFNFLKIAEDYTTGSSIMPQKMNPDIAEKIRSKISTVAANFNQILFCLK
jgi:argininosuccinate lyase